MLTIIVVRGKVDCSSLKGNIHGWGYIHTEKMKLIENDIVLRTDTSALISMKELLTSQQECFQDVSCDQVTLNHMHMCITPIRPLTLELLRCCTSTFLDPTSSNRASQKTHHVLLPKWAHLVKP